MRQRRKLGELEDNYDWMEPVAKGVLWAESLVIGLLTISLLIIGTGLYPLPVLTESVLRGVLARW